MHKIDPEKNKKIIDIGGGWGDLERGLRRDDIVVYEPNKDYVERAKKYVKVAIEGNGEYLEVRDEEFDIAISVHTFEHIAKKNRPQFLQEMTRVSQHVVLIFPFEKWANKLCHDIINYCGRINVQPSPFTVEHIEMGIPVSRDLEELFGIIDDFEFTIFTQQNFYMDKMLFYVFYSKVPFSRILLLPINSIISFMFRNASPHTTVVVVGKRIKNATTQQKEAKE